MILSYRPEIDGLRAVAVLAVVIFHAEFVLGGDALLPGGFIGVDVFFVISGYLITSIILRELDAGKFTFRGFYERRARRILPALLTVMVVSLPFAWFLMLPKAVQELGGSILSSLAFSSNVWFWLEDSYWAEPSELKPFLHTWSLSVEEQFYVFFPVVLLGLWSLSRGLIMPVFLVGFVASMGLAQYGVSAFPEANFYLPFSRAWELLAGGILAKLEQSSGRHNPAILNRILPTIGLILICASFVLFQGDTAHPSLISLVPVVGTMLLIRYGTEGEIITKLLSSRPFVSIGLVSYSFYLWHFPVFAFARIADLFSTQYERLALTVLSLLLSVATYFLVERTFRNRSFMGLRTFLTVILGTTALVAAVSATVFLNGGQWGRYSDAQMTMLGVGEDREPFVDYVLAYSKTTRKSKVFSDENDRNDVFVIGDSYSGDFLNALNEGGYLDGIEVLSHKISWDCHNVPSGAEVADHIEPKSQDTCAKTVRVGDADLTERLRAADLVILASAWTEYATSRMEELVAAVRRESDAPVMIVGRKHFGKIRLQELFELSEADFIALRQESRHHLAAIEGVPSQVQDSYVDLHRLFCGDSRSCPIATPEGYLISYDGGHLTREGAVHLSTLLEQDDNFSRIWQQFRSNLNTGVE